VNDSSRKSVTIVGAGVAGLSAALRLAQRGFKVKLYEAGERAGGNLGSTTPDNLDSVPPDSHKQGSEPEALYEVFPHMYADWYNNFFVIMAELGLYRDNRQPDMYGDWCNRYYALMKGLGFIQGDAQYEDDRGPHANTPFQKCERWGYLSDDGSGRYRYVVNDGWILDFWKNLFSGAAAPADVYLSEYAVIDILTQDFFDFTKFRSLQTLNGFLASRWYFTEGMAEIFQSEMVDIWAVNSDVTSAYAYQRFAAYQAARPRPSNWVLDGNPSNMFIDLWVQKLVDLKVEVMLNTTVEGITVEDGKITSICISCVKHPGGKVIELAKGESLIMAVPQSALGELVLKSAKMAATGKAEPKELQETIGYFAPELAAVQNFEVAKLAVLYAAFNRALPDIPECYVALDKSEYALTFIQLPYLARELNVPMVLAIAISEITSLPLDLDDLTREFDRKSVNVLRRQAEKMVLEEFSKYIPIKVEDGDVNWDKTYLKTNATQTLFLNIVGSQANAPKVHYPKIENLYFAVGTKENPITIATLECAVYGGLQAAEALWTRNPESRNNTHMPIEPIVPDSYSLPVIWAWKMAMTPYAAAAKWWSACEDVYGVRAWDLAQASRGFRYSSRRASRGPVDAVREFGNVAVQAMAASLDFWSGMASALLDGRSGRARYGRRRA
jgi:zeta-carotene desaturase